MMTTMSKPIDLVLASAGTGKTYRLTETLCRWVTDPDGAVEPEAIIATTFTVKAAGELVARTRGRLLAHGNNALAERLLGGRIGTVNSIAGQLLTEFALDAGLSPVANVLDEERQRELFRVASADAIDSRLSALVNVSGRLGLDLCGTVAEIVNAARQNGLAPADLAASAERSWQGLRSLLRLPSETADTLDRELQRSVDSAIAALAGGCDTTQATQNVCATLRDLQPRLHVPEAVSWQTWAKLSKLKPGTASRTIVAPVVNAASAHPGHPRLHADLEALIRGLFDAAAEAITLYDTVKRELGLIDFVDQERLALDLLHRPAIEARLRERVRVLLVDEFQDTSPLHLALFLRFARIVGRSLWVGDPKQAIYGFRGTDPELIRAITGGFVQAANGTVDYLDTSYRSRPGLVAFTNDLFTPAFAAAGFTQRETRIEHVHRNDEPGQPGPIEVWWLEGESWKAAVDSLTSGVRSMLDASGRWQIADRNGTRPVHGGDIAILCRSNARCVEVATALAAAGLKVGVARENLMDQPEVVHAFSALRYLVDPRDHLAVAELLHLRQGSERGSTWLDDWLRDGLESVRNCLPELAALDEARQRLASATPAEALDLALSASDSLAFAQRLGDPRRRIANLDALRGLAKSYEDGCVARRAAATASGLVAFLRHDLKNGGPQPASPDREAVHVLTYHKAKGLEWPVVILLDLDHEPRDRTFGLTVEPRDDGFDVQQPLQGRWLRLWPWPYGGQKRNVFLDAQAEATLESARGRERERAEKTRLLYVGMTRARDCLVLAARPATGGTAWLDSLMNSSGIENLPLPRETGAQQITLSGVSHPVEVRTFAAGIAGGSAVAIETVYTAQPSPDRPVHAPYRLRPSETGYPGGMQIVEDITLGARLPLAGAPEMSVLGEALHRFLAADRADADQVWRLNLAQRLLRAWGVTALSPDACIEAANRLRTFLERRYPRANWRHEWPITGQVDRQRARGQIDLLLEGSERLAIVDHKSFPGHPKDWPERALKAGGQIATYAEMARAGTGKPIDLWVHMPIVGRLMRIEPLR